MARPLKTRWPRCVICGTYDGEMAGVCKTPQRIHLGRFGIAALACKTCYDRIHKRAKRGLTVDPWTLKRPYGPRRKKVTREQP